MDEFIKLLDPSLDYISHEINSINDAFREDAGKQSWMGQACFILRKSTVRTVYVP